MHQSLLPVTGTTTTASHQPASPEPVLFLPGLVLTYPIPSYRRPTVPCIMHDSIELRPVRVAVPRQIPAPTRTTPRHTTLRSLTLTQHGEAPASASTASPR